MANGCSPEYIHMTPKRGLCDNSGTEQDDDGFWKLKTMSATSRVGLDPYWKGSVQAWLMLGRGYFHSCCRAMPLKIFFECTLSESHPLVLVKNAEVKPGWIHYRVEMSWWCNILP